MNDNLWRQRPDAGSRFADRRAVPRFEFLAPVEVIEPLQKTRVVGQVTEISQNGCFAEVPTALAVNSIIQVRILRGDVAFESWARVVYNRAESGLGLFFIDTAPDQWKLLASWLIGLKGI